GRRTPSLRPTLRQPNPCAEQYNMSGRTAWGWRLPGPKPEPAARAAKNSHCALSEADSAGRILRRAARFRSRGASGPAAEVAHRACEVQTPRMSEMLEPAWT